MTSPIPGALPSEAAALLTAILDALPEAALLLDARSVVALANTSALTLLSADADAVVGAALDALLAPLPGPLAALVEGAQEGVTGSVEVRLELGWGMRCLRATASPLAGPGALVLLRLLDEGPVRQLRAELEFIRGHFEAAQRQAQLGIIEYDLGGSAPWWSSQSYALLGWPREHPPPPLPELPLRLREQDRGAAREVIARALESQEPITLVARVEPPGEPRRIVRLTLMAQRAGAQPPRLSIIVQDVTVEYEARVRLESTHGTLNLVLEHAPCYIAILRADNSMEYVNRLNPQYDPALIEQNPLHYFDAEDLSRHSENFKRLFSGEETVFEYRDTLGSWYESHAVPIWEGGEVTRAIMFILDTTERHAEQEERLRLQGQLQHAQKLESLGILAGGIAHDFNNLLSAIIGHAELTERAVARGRPMGGSLGEIIRASERASQLCQQLLAYSGRGQFVVETVDLGQIVSDITSLLELSVHHRVRVEYDLPPALPPIRADISQIQQIAMNLITNAAESITQPPGRIVVRTGAQTLDREALAQTWIDDNLPEGLYTFLEVSDSGAGMIPEVRARIFDPFFSSKGPGRGLGLAAVLGIVRGHHGALEVHSVPGGGTVVRIYLPASQEAPSVSATRAAAVEPRVAARTYLVVDDEASIRMLLTDALVSEGHHVVTAADGQEAVEVFARSRGTFDAVLLDLTMPNLDGYATLAQLRGIDASVPVVLMSGYTTPLEGEEVQPADAFLPKPFRLAEVTEVLEQVSAQREARWRTG